MAAFSILNRISRTARVLSNNEQQGKIWIQSFGLQKQLYRTKPVYSAAQDKCAVSYLVNSFGLSQESAALVSQKVKLQSFEKPNSVLALLRKYEFSDTQISTIVLRHPHILVADAQKTLLPKLEFFSSVGIPRLDLVAVLAYYPFLLERSLENFIKPCYNFIKSVVVSDVKFVSIWKHSGHGRGIIINSFFKTVVPNVEFVSELGMARSCVALLLTDYARIVSTKPAGFSHIVGEVKEMGFDPQKMSFVYAMHVLAAKETWKRSQEAYRSWGWSEDHILSAFRKRPLCMMVSEKKLMEKMDFLVNKMGWHSHKIAKWPSVMCYSLEKRVIPRSSVVRVLLLKGLIEEKKLILSSVFDPLEEYFFKRFVTRYLDRVPQLSDVYQGKIRAEDV